MATFDNTAILKEYYRAFNEKDFERARTLIQPEALVQNVALGATMKLIEHSQAWASAFPDGQVEVLNLVAQGDQVVAEFIGRGTHTGPLLGPGGLRIPPSQRRLEMRFVEIFEFRNGRMASGRQYFDALGLMTQLGLAPQPVQAPRPEAPMSEARH